MKSIALKALHKHVYTFQMGEWVWLPGSEWKLQFFASRIVAKHMNCELMQEISWSASSWIEHFEVSLDIYKGCLKLIVHEHTRKIHIECLCYQDQPVWVLQRLAFSTPKSTPQQLLAQQAKNHKIDSMLTLDVCLNGQPAVMRLKEGIDIASRLQAMLAPQPCHHLQLWFGTHKKLHWQQVLLRENPFEIAHLVIAMSRWLPEKFWFEKELIPFDLSSPYSADWTKNWWMKIKPYTKGLFIFDYDLNDPLNPLHFTQKHHPLKLLASFAHAFLSPWVEVKQDHQVTIKLKANASRRIVSGRLLGLELDHPKLTLAWRWQKERSWSIEIQSCENSQISLELYPQAKSCRVQSDGEFKMLDLKGKFLDVELKAGANYKINRFIF